MKLRKIVSFIVTAAAAAACSAAFFAVNAGAFKKPDGDFAYKSGDTFVPITDLETFISHYGSIYEKVGPDPTDYVEYDGDNTYNEFVLDGGDNDYILTPGQLNALKNKGFKTLMTNKLYAGSYEYYVYLIKPSEGTTPAINFFSGVSSFTAPANIGLTITTESNTTGGGYTIPGNGTLKIASDLYTYNTLYSDQIIYYKIPAKDSGNSQFKRMLTNAGVDLHDKIRVYTSTGANASDQDTIKIIEASGLVYDLNLTFNGDEHHAKNYYYTAYNKENMEDFIKNDEIQNYLVKELSEKLGFSETDLTDTNLKKYIDDAANDIMDLLFEKDPSTGDYITDVKFVTKDKLGDLIKAYYTNDDENKNHLKELAAALIASDENTNLLKNYIYDVFGLSTTDGVVKVVSQETQQSIITSILDKLFGTGTDFTQYKTAISYYFSQEGYEKIKALHDELTSLLNTLKKPDNTPYSNVSELLSELYAYKNALVDAGVDTDFTNLVTKVKEASDFLGNTAGKTLSQTIKDALSSYTTSEELKRKIDDALSGYATKDQLTDYAKNDGNVNKDNISQYFNEYGILDISDLNGYIKASDLAHYLDLFGVLTDSDVNSLKKRIEDLESRVKTLEGEMSNIKSNPFYYYYAKQYPYYYYDGHYYNINDWAYSQYGNSDTYMNALVNEVIRRIGNSNYGSNGLSAYDIAVKNGFKGTEQAWLNSLVGESAYEIAVKNGFNGSEAAWLNSLKGADGKDGKDGKDGRDGEDGRDGRDGKDGKDGKDGRNGSNGSDGDDGRIVYVYGNNRASSAAPTSESVSDVTKTAAYINDNGGTTSDTTNKTTTTTAAATNVTTTSRTANPSTGVAAGIIIPAAAAASLFLVKKDKRRRGRK